MKDISFVIDSLVSMCIISKYKYALYVYLNTNAAHAKNHSYSLNNLLKKICLIALHRIITIIFISFKWNRVNRYKLRKIYNGNMHCRSYVNSIAVIYLCSYDKSECDQKSVLKLLAQLSTLYIYIM